MKTKTPNMKTIAVKVPVEVHRALKMLAAEKGKSIAVTVEGLVREYIRKEGAHD